MKISIYILVILLFNSGCIHAQSEEKEIFKTLKEFYIAYNTVWVTDIDQISLMGRLDSLRQEYCSKKLRDELSIDYQSHGLDHDRLINDLYADVESIKNLEVKKDVNAKNIYIVVYDAISYSSSTGKEMKVENSIRVTVIKENGRFKIDKVW